MTRYDYIDIAKGIGILLVVWAHILITGVSHRVIYAFHMPLFFLISGILFRRDKYKNFLDFLQKRAKRLLVPFVIYSIVTWIFWASFRFIRHDEVASYWDPLLQTIVAKGSGAYMVHNSALWFIPCLFVTEIMYYGLCNFSYIVRIAICVCCASLSFILGHYFSDDWWYLLPWNFDAALIAILFYCIGNILSAKISNQKIVDYSKTHAGTMTCLFVILSIVLYWSAIEFGECSMGSSSYQCSGAIFIIRAFIGCVACIMLSIFFSFISSKNLLKKYLINEGKYSLDIMSIHIPIKGVVILGLGIVLRHSAEIISTSLLYSAVAFIITMVIVDILVLAINRGKQLYNLRLKIKE